MPVTQETKQNEKDLSKETNKETVSVDPVEFEALKQENAEMKAMLQGLMDRMGPAEDPAAKEKTGGKFLDRSKPFSVERNIGGFWYEQDGNKFNGKGEFVEPVKKSAGRTKKAA